jgi:hypothetical protein
LNWLLPWFHSNLDNENNCGHGAKSVHNLTWEIVLIIVGLVGGGIAGFLVLLGGVFGLITSLSEKA